MNTEPSMSPQKRLPDSWARKIFDEMHNHYGNRFLNMWKLNQTLPNGEDIGIAKAMNRWAEKLGGFSDHPEVLRYALDNLPEDPPSLPQFMNLCRLAPRKEAPALEHKFTPEQLERNKQRVREAIEMLAKKKSINNGANHDQV